MMMNKVVFNLNERQQEIVAELEQKIKLEIAASGGYIPFNRYMELALYEPGLGYYTNGLYKFGEQGDFITAPMISNLFGYTLAKQIIEIFSFGVTKNILEFGAGNGKLLVDILTILGESIDKYYVIELSADLIEWQKETLAKKAPQFINKVQWLSTLPNNFEGVVIANEVLDALPSTLVKYSLDKNICGVGVTLDSQDKLKFVDYPLSKDVQTIAKQLPIQMNSNGVYQTEINLVASAFITSIAQNLRKGAVLLVDYGSAQKECYHPEKYIGTLRGFYHHQVVDNILQYPGMMDITTSVDFTNIAVKGVENKLDLIGYTSQGNFLLNLGILDDLAMYKEVITHNQYLQLTNQVNKLTTQLEMGNVFKVIGFSKNLEQDSWQGFCSGDLSYTL